MERERIECSLERVSGKEGGEGGRGWKKEKIPRKTVYKSGITSSEYLFHWQDLVSVVGGNATRRERKREREDGVQRERVKDEGDERNEGRRRSSWEKEKNRRGFNCGIPSSNVYRGPPSSLFVSPCPISRAFIFIIYQLSQEPGPNSLPIQNWRIFPLEIYPLPSSSFSFSSSSFPSS